MKRRSRGSASAPTVSVDRPVDFAMVMTLPVLPVLG
jgi:hypothetical protein